MSIKDLRKKYGNGKGLIIRLDNDHTQVFNEEIAKKWDKNEEADYIFEGEGYGDMHELWNALFPEADVDGV